MTKLLVSSGNDDKELLVIIMSSLINLELSHQPELLDQGAPGNDDKELR